MRHLRKLLYLAVFASQLVVASKGRAEATLDTISVPMRDGVLLATDVYRDQAITNAPVVLMRTPYNKGRAKAMAERLANAGYAAVVQDCRGVHASEGVMIPYNNEGQDGYDTIEWIGRQSWCNGRIGMWGGSYVGATQWQAAVEHPPGLVTIMPTATWSSFYGNLYLGGAVRLSLITRWAGGNSSRPEGAKPTNNWDQTLLHLPLSEIDREIGWPIPWLAGMLTHPSPNGYWKRLNLTDEITELELPMLHVVGYYDFFARETVGNFVQMQKHAVNPKTRRQQYLVLGPWDHGSIGRTKVGEVDFGPNAARDASQATLEWFDRFLKQDPATRTKPVAPVRYFSMGENAWRNAATWPPRGFELTAFYLHSGGRANTKAGDGSLNRTAPTEKEPADHFRADPANPAPANPTTEKRPLYAATWAPVDQSPVEDRPDVLAFTSAPLTEPLTFAGNAKAELYVSADTRDADWVVKLVDVWPNGFAQNLAVGILRGSFRDSELHPQPLTPGEVYKIAVDLGPIAAQLAPKHRLRIDICGAYFPLFDRNPNTAEGPFSSHTAVATETVYHTSVRPSRLWLPVRKP